MNETHDAHAARRTRERDAPGFVESSVYFIALWTLSALLIERNLDPAAIGVPGDKLALIAGAALPALFIFIWLVRQLGEAFDSVGRALLRLQRGVTGLPRRIRRL